MWSSEFQKLKFRCLEVMCSSKWAKIGKMAIFGPFEAQTMFKAIFDILLIILAT